MKCNECEKYPATLHFTQYINGQKEEIHVCELCAKKKGYQFQQDESYSLHDLLSTLFHISTPDLDRQSKQLFQQKESLECSKCHLTFEGFQRIGKFGCAKCYETFEIKLPQVFRRVHSGNTKHVGKIPVRKGGSLHMKKELTYYREKLNHLIEEEAFEDAAIVRDEIRRLESLKEGDQS